MQNPVSHYTVSVKTDAQGKFEFDNVPFNNYHLVVTVARISVRRTGCRRALARRSRTQVHARARRSQTSIEVRAEGAIW